MEGLDRVAIQLQETTWGTSFSLQTAIYLIVPAPGLTLLLNPDHNGFKHNFFRFPFWGGGKTVQNISCDFLAIDPEMCVNLLPCGQKRQGFSWVGSSVLESRQLRLVGYGMAALCDL